MESIIQVIIGLSILCLGGGCLYLNRVIRAERAQRLILAKALQRVDGEISALSRGAVGLGQRIVGLEQYWRETKEQQDRLELSHGKERQYDHALRLVRNGRGVEDILSSCDFTRSEVELMIKMNEFQCTG